MFYCLILFDWSKHHLIQNFLQTTILKSGNGFYENPAKIKNIVYRFIGTVLKTLATSGSCVPFAVGRGKLGSGTGHKTTLTLVQFPFFL